VLLLLSPRPSSAQPTPQPLVAPGQRNYGQYTRAFQQVPAVGRFGHIAAATASKLVLAGGRGDAPPNTALPTNFMNSGGVNVYQTLTPAQTRLDQMQMPLFRTAFDVFPDEWAPAQRDDNILLSFGGPDFTGKQATNWLLRLQFGATQAYSNAGQDNWTWIDLGVPGIVDPRSRVPLARIGAAAASLQDW
jgi:hypothetical protein